MDQEELKKELKILIVKLEAENVELKSDVDETLVSSVISFSKGQIDAYKKIITVL